MAFSQAHEVEPWFHKVTENLFFFIFFLSAQLKGCFFGKLILCGRGQQGISAHDAVDVLERKESGSFLFRPSST
jgi:hypothetical protein